LGPTYLTETYEEGKTARESEKKEKKARKTGPRSKAIRGNQVVWRRRALPAVGVQWWDGANLTRWGIVREGDVPPGKGG